MSSQGTAPNDAATPRVFSLDELRAAAGTEIAVSDWYDVTQSAIDAFADAIHDPQWIHVDAERAARDSPFRDARGVGHTVAHGFLTLSLLTHLRENTFEVAGRRTGVNIGFDRVRFVAPVMSGSRVRARFVLAAIRDVPGGAQLVWDATVERENESKPALVARWLTRVLF